MRNLKSIFAVLSLIFALSLAASAQSVTLTSIDGQKIDVQGQKDKVVVLAIGASWLPLSNQQAIFINKLAKKYANSDVVIYFIATDSISAKSKNFASDDEIRKFASANKMNVTVLRDSDGSATLKKYNIDQLPSFVILDKNGKMAAEPYSGIAVDPKNDITVFISQAIDKIL